MKHGWIIKPTFHVTYKFNDMPSEELCCYEWFVEGGNWDYPEKISKATILGRLHYQYWENPCMQNRNLQYVRLECFRTYRLNDTPDGEIFERFDRNIIIKMPEHLNKIMR